MTVASPPTYDDLRSLMTRMTGDEKHDSSATSTLDALWVLYDRVLRFDRGDRFLLSKGHGPAAYYAVLAAFGFLDAADLSGFGGFDSPLGHHPDRMLVPGVGISSGSLGHGLGLAAGTALGLRIQGRDARVVVMLGDAELDEGSNAEAIQFIGRSGMDNVTAVVVDNSSASLGWPGGLARRFAVEDWVIENVDGRDHDALYRAFTARRGGRPLAVVAQVERKDQ